MNEEILMARQMARVALITRDAAMWESAHNILRGCLQCR